MHHASSRAGKKPAFRIGLVLLAAAMLPAPMSAQTPGLVQGERFARPKEELASAEAFARQFLADVMAEEGEKVLAAFDLDAIATAVVDGLGKNERARAAIRQGVEAKLPETFGGVFRQLQGSPGTFKRIVVAGDQLHARCRFDSEAGIVFLDLALTKRGTSWRIDEIHNRSVGLSMVAQMHNMVALLDKEIDPGALARLLGTTKVSPKDVDTMQSMVQAFQAGDAVEALRLYGKLPKVLQETAAATNLRIQCLSATEDQDAYVAALEDAAARFPAPMFRLTLVDAHFLRQQWQKAIAAIDEAMQSLDRDAGLLTLRAMLQLQSGDVPGARKTLAEAMQLEPECVYVLLTGLDVLLAAKDWTAVAAALKTLEKTGKYDFRGNLGDEVWAEFVKAPESEPWR